MCGGPTDCGNDRWCADCVMYGELAEYNGNVTVGTYRDKWEPRNPSRSRIANHEEEHDFTQLLLGILILVIITLSVLLAVAWR